MHLLLNKTCINGQWLNARNDQTFEVTNPATTEIITTVPDMDTESTQIAIDAAFSAFQSWKHTTAKQRSKCLRKWFNLIVTNQKDLAEIITLEAGKPLTESLEEVSYGASFVEFFSEEPRRIYGEILPSPSLSKKILIEKHPIGVVGLITPWNFPFALVARKAAAALAAGCTCVIKPSEDTPLSALALMKLSEEAEIPNGVLNVITSSRKNAPGIGKLLCQSPRVAGISFTGSTPIGKLLYKECSSGIKRLGLELGGDAPFIVYNSANLDKAVEGVMTSKFRNCGQTCISSNRFLVQNDIYDQFVVNLVEKVQLLKMGNLHNPQVKIGPLINQQQFDKVSNLVQDAVSKGAKILIGGKGALKYGKLFYEPTVLTAITDNMKIFKEEVFGPVVNIMRFSSEEESIKIANNTNTGLAGYFYSEDVAQIFRVWKRLEVGMCGVNEGAISMAEIPFGGIKESGLGREGSHYGIDDYVYVKYVCLGNL